MNTTVIQVPEGYRIQAAFDGYFYPQIQDGNEYEYCWWESGEDVRFLTEAEAVTYILVRVTQ